MSKRTKQHRVRESNVRVLEDAVHTNELKIQEYNQRALLGALALARMAPAMEQSSWMIDNVVDPRDYLGNEYQSPQIYSESMPTQIWNREMGRNFPIFLTEIELRYIRGMGRQMADFHPIGKGVMNKIVNYTIGPGITLAAVLNRFSNMGDGIVLKINKVLDHFMEYNEISCGADQEVCLRDHRDGDGAVSLWHEGGERVALRFVEPDQITQPGPEQQILEWMGYDGSPSTMLFGIHSDVDDVMNVHGYYVQWSSNGLDWDYLPGGWYPFKTLSNKNTWCEFFKCNVDRQIKRGISDFFPTETAMRLIQKVLRNTGEGAAVQAAIAFIRQHMPGVTATQISQFQSGLATDQLTLKTSTGTQQTYSKKIYPGMVMDIPKGQQYLAGPMGVNNAEIYVEVADALARSAAVRWDMPEWMLNASTKNNNRASGFIAESPFLKSISIEQKRQCSFWRKIAWKVIEFAVEGKVIDVPVEVLKQHLQIEVRAPQISVRQPEKETIRREILWKNGIISSKKWAEEEGYDHDQELKAGAKPELKIPPRPGASLEPETPPGLMYARAE